ncbi:hypothetical protein V2I01_13720 [Micromonospora sp. BRA006-A]|nr:hypothetical protein [Micromonospora sp. BRA006-A]
MERVAGDPVPGVPGGLLGGASRLGPVIGDRAVLAQPVDIGEVADRLAVLLLAGPSNRVEDFGGPEVLRFDDAARAWLAARRVRRPLLPVRIPGRLGRELRAGGLTTTATPTGVRTWADHLADTYGEPAEDEKRSGPPRPTVTACWSSSPQWSCTSSVSSSSTA